MPLIFTSPESPALSLSTTATQPLPPTHQQQPLPPKEHPRHERREPRGGNLHNQRGGRQNKAEQDGLNVRKGGEKPVFGG
jgi:hypothetical protein